MGAGRTFGAGVLALALSAATASGAAGANKLVLTTPEGAMVGKGTPVLVGFELGECVTFAEGVLDSNEKATDKVAISKTPPPEECPGTLSGRLTQVQVDTAGKYAAKGKLLYTVKGCAYQFNSFKGTFAVPGEVTTSNGVIGKVDKKLSEPSCEKTKFEEFFADLASAPYGDPWNATVTA